MYRKIDIKHLAIVFSLLLIVVIVVKWSDRRQGGRTFKDHLVKVNQELVTAIEISPKVSGRELIRLSLEGDIWMVESKGKRYIADQSVPFSLMGELNSAVPERVVATGKDRWAQYEVTDSLGSRVKVFEGSKVVADLIMGRYSFSESRKMTTYIREADEREVYGVEGMMGMSFNRNIDGFRNRTVLRSSTADWKRLSFSYPSDSSFVLEKMGGRWSINGEVADSIAVDKYFNAIRNLTESRFSQENQQGEPSHKLRVEGDNQMIPIDINGYFLDNGHIVIESSQNRGNLFDGIDLAKKIFISRSQLIN